MGQFHLTVKFLAAGLASRGGFASGKVPGARAAGDGEEAAGWEPLPSGHRIQVLCAGNKLTGRDRVARGQLRPCGGGLSPSPTPTPVPKSGRCFRDGDSGRGGVGEWGRGGPAPPRPLRATAPPAGPAALRSALRTLGQTSFFCRFPTSSPGPVQALSSGFSAGRMQLTRYFKINVN